MTAPLYDQVIGQCPHCGGNLTNGHECPPTRARPTSPPSTPTATPDGASQTAVPVGPQAHATPSGVSHDALVSQLRELSASFQESGHSATLAAVDCRECEATATMRQAADAITALTRELQEARRLNDDFREALLKICQWADAYPISVFPEPNWEVARQALESAGITLDSVSASNMRHVVTGAGKIARAALRDGVSECQCSK